MPTATKKRPKAKRTVKKSVTSKTKKRVVAKRSPKMKIVGRVSHYYDRIGVAIIELAGPLVMGDVVLFKRGQNEHLQQIASIQIDHLGVEKAKKGDVVGVKVSREVKSGSLVMPA